MPMGLSTYHELQTDETTARSVVSVDVLVFQIKEYSFVVLTINNSIV